MQDRFECARVVVLGNNKAVVTPVPGWMLEKEKTEDLKAGNSNTGFLRRTMAEISGMLQNDLLAERFASARGLMQGIDARLKLLTLLFFMVFTGVTQSFTTLLFLFFIALMLVKMSALELSSYFKRVWLLLPLALFILSIPAATNLFIAGKPLFHIYIGLDPKLPFVQLPRELYISREGAGIIFKMALRVGISVSYGYLLVMTTGWSHLARALAVLKVPRLFITILDMTYRYIFVLSKLAVEIFEARSLRTVGKVNNRENRKFVSSSIAFLFVRASFLSEEIYDSMLCRGYSGEPVSLAEFRLTRSDAVWIVNFLVIAIVLVLL